MSEITNTADDMLIELRKVLIFLQKGEITDANLLKTNIVSTSIMALQSAATLKSLADTAAETAAKTQMFELFMARYFANSLNAKSEFASFSQDCLRMAGASKDPERYEATERSLARLDEVWQLIESTQTPDLVGENYS